MVEENISQEFKLENIEETKNYFLKEVEQTELMGKKYNNIGATLNYTEHVLILASTITRCISISVFALTLGIPIGFTSSTIEFKKCVIDIFSKYTWVVPSEDKKGITEVVTKYKSISNVFQNILNESNRKPKKYG